MQGLPTEVLNALQQQIFAWLQQQSTTVGEYELLKFLQAENCIGFPEQRLSSSLSTFQQHFLLQHLLYRLQQQLHQDQSADLEISALSIRLHPYQAAKNALSTADPVRDYYLDWNNMQTMDQTQLEELLGQFWQRFAQHQTPSSEVCRTALAALDLSESADWQTIQQRYRQLVMRHHPDRGGDDEAVQKLNQAMTVLKQHREHFG